MQGPDAAGHASYLFCNEHVSSIKVLAEHIKWGQSCGFSVRLLEYRGGLLCWYSLPSTRHNSRCRPEITNGNLPPKGPHQIHMAWGLGEVTRVTGACWFCVSPWPMPPCTCTATTHLDTKRSSSHGRCSRHGMWCLLILNYGMRSDVGQCMIHGHQVDKP